MYTLTEQDIKFLDDIAGRIETATKHDYARNMQTIQVEYLKVLYKKMYGTEYVGSSSCSTCQLRLLKKVGEWLEKRKLHEDLVPYLRKLSEVTAYVQTHKGRAIQDINAYILTSITSWHTNWLSRYTLAE